jgi:hypothetical protein
MRLIMVGHWSNRIRWHQRAHNVSAMWTPTENIVCQPVSKSSHQELNPPTPGSWASQFPDLCATNFFHLSHPVCYVLW